MKFVDGGLKTQREQFVNLIRVIFIQSGSAISIITGNIDKGPGVYKSDQIIAAFYTASCATEWLRTGL